MNNPKMLWNYLDSKRRLRRAREDLAEFESEIYTPPGTNTSGMPVEHGTENSDKLASAAQKHKELLDAKDAAVLEATRAYAVLEAFAATLSDDERDVLYARYRKGMTIRDMEASLHKCERTLRYTIKRIKNKFSAFCT